MNTARHKRRSLLLPLLCLLAALFPCFATSAAAVPLVLDSEVRYSLAGHLEILVDSGGALTFTDILTPANQERFTPIPGFVNRSYTNDTVWVRVAIARTPFFPHDPTLRLWPPYLDHVALHVQTGDRPNDPASYRHLLLGDHYPVAARPLIDADLAIPLELPANRVHYIYLQVRTTSALNLSATIHTEPDYITYGSLNVARQAAYLAITLVITLINLIFFIRLRDRLYLYFSLYVFALFVIIFPASGIMSLIWPSMVHRLSDYLIGIGAASSLYFFSLFGKQLFVTADKPWLQRFFICLGLIAGITALSVPLGFYNRTAPALFISMLATALILTILSIIQVRRGTEGAYVYLAAFGICNVGYIVQFLRLLGVLPVAWWNMNAVELASVTNMILMTLALTEQLNRAERRALQASLAAEQRAMELADQMTIDLQHKHAELELALERKARFVEMVSHEYRTPLAIIRANLDILELREETQTSGVATNIVKMQRAVARLVDVIESSLIRSRLQYAELEQKRELLDAADFLVDVRDEARSLWPDAAIALPPADLPSARILVDPSLIKTALFNLVDNAVKYAAAAGTITMTLAVSPTEVRMDVVDQGPGIPENERGTVRAKYQRGKAASVKPGGGLGLFLVSKIVEEHLGRLELSANVPSGTIATIVLPRAE